MQQRPKAAEDESTPQLPRRRQSEVNALRALAKWAAVGTATVGMLGFALPAAASQSGSVTVTLNTTGPAESGRTLLLYDTSGQPLSSLDLSTGTRSFVAEVVDNSNSLTGYTVQASMSNLYGYNGGNWSCTATIPSSAVSISTPPALLDASGVASTITPEFQVTGSLTNALSNLTGLNLSSESVTDAVVTGLSQALTEAYLAAGNTGQLIGSTLTTVNPGLPIQINAGVGGAFATPAADPSGANCGQTGPGTAVPVMTGLAHETDLVSDLQALLSKLPNQSAATLIGNGYLDSNSVISSVATALGVPINLISSDASAIENALTVSLASTPLESALDTETGSYAASPAVTVDTSGVPDGSYRGTMTITEVDGNPPQGG